MLPKYFGRNNDNGKNFTIHEITLNRILSLGGVFLFTIVLDIFEVYGSSFCLVGIISVKRQHFLMGFCLLPGYFPLQKAFMTINLGGKIFLHGRVRTCEKLPNNPLLITRNLKSHSFCSYMYSTSCMYK